MFSFILKLDNSYRVSQKEVPPTFEKSFKKIRMCYG